MTPQADPAVPSIEASCAAVTYASGDKTVPYQSLRWPVTWRAAGVDVQPVEVEGGDHRGIIGMAPCHFSVLQHAAHAPALELAVRKVTLGRSSMHRLTTDGDSLKVGFPPSPRATLHRAPRPRAALLRTASHHPAPRLHAHLGSRFVSRHHLAPQSLTAPPHTAPRRTLLRLWPRCHAPWDALAQPHSRRASRAARTAPPVRCKQSCDECFPLLAARATSHLGPPPAPAEPRSPSPTTPSTTTTVSPPPHPPCPAGPFRLAQR